jgi:hypothetical protein
MKTFMVKNTSILDATQEDWLYYGLSERTPEGEFPRNAAHKVERRSATELYIMNTEDVELLFRVRS